MVDAALEVSRDGGLPTRVWRGLTGRRGRQAGASRAVSYSQVAVKRFVRRVRRQVNRAPARRRRQLPDGEPAGDPVADRSEARRQARCAPTVERRSIATGTARRVRGERQGRAAEGHDRASSAKKYPHVVTVDRPAFRLRYFRDLKLAKTLQDRGRPGGPRDARPACTTCRTRPRTLPGTCPNSDWAGDLAGKVIPGGRADNPLKARWLGIYDGAGIHGTADDRLARQRRLPRLHPDGGPGCRGALRQGAGADACLHPVVRTLRGNAVCDGNSGLVAGSPRP